MNELLASIKEQLREVKITVTCPVCGESQLAKLGDFSPIRLGTKYIYTGTGGYPMVQCEHCKAEGKTTLIHMNKRFYDEIQKAILNAIEEQPTKYINARFEDTTICVSE